MGGSTFSFALPHDIMTHIPYPAFLDIEASGLYDESYPVEIAWCNRSGKVSAHLIRPSDDWNHWDAKAAEIHGISRQQLFQDGMEARDLCELVRQFLAGRTVYTDAPSLDRMWLDRLFTAGEGRRCPLLVLGISEIPEFRQAFYQRGLFDQLKQEAVAAIGQTHRAAADVAVFIHNYPKL